MIKDDFNVSWYEVSATTRASLLVVLSQSARLIACSHRCRLFFLNGWDPAGILKNLTPELVRFSQSTTQQVGILSRAVDGGRDNRVTGGGRLPPAVVHVTSHTGCI